MIIIILIMIITIITINVIVRGSTDSEAAVVEHLAAMIKVKFDTALADSIIPKLRDTPEWLKKLMADKTFRKMLIELHDQNRNSTLIKIALKEICRMGHHRYDLI
jgi:DNA mismatch repair ATPase MutL